VDEDKVPHFRCRSGYHKGIHPSLVVAEHPSLSGVEQRFSNEFAVQVVRQRSSTKLAQRRPTTSDLWRAAKPQSPQSIFDAVIKHRFFDDFRIASILSHLNHHEANHIGGRNRRLATVFVQIDKVFVLEVLIRPRPEAISEGLPRDPPEPVIRVSQR